MLDAIKQFVFMASLLALFFHGCKALTNSCRKAPNCTCLHSDESYEYQCPTLEHLDVIIQVVPDKFINIDCYNYNSDLVPSNIYQGNVPDFTIRFCPLPENFQTFLNTIGVNSTESLQFSGSSLQNVTLTGEHLSGLERLKVLKLEDNDLEHVTADAFQSMQNLNNLYVSNNKIKLVPGLFDRLHQLKILDLSENELTELPSGIFDQLPNLQVLELWHNNLTSLRGDVFGNLTRLESLELSYNKLKELPETIFHNLYALKVVNLGGNDLGGLSESLFAYNKLLEKVRINRNPNVRFGSALLANLPKLRTVELMYNNLSYLLGDLFQNSTDVEEVWLKRNNLRSLPDGLFESLSKLKAINLNGNKLEVLHDSVFGSLISLTDLQLEQNALRTIEKDAFSSLPNLRKINLKDNELVYLPDELFLKNGKLTHVDLSHNKLDFKTTSTIIRSPFNRCTELQELNLSHNLLEEMAPELVEDIMIGKPEMRAFDLSYNRIEFVEIYMLQKVSTHQLSVNLSHNNISSIGFLKAEIMAQTQDKIDILNSKDYSSVVDISNNPIECDCRMYDLSRYIHDMFDPRLKTLINLLTEDITCPSQPDVKIDDLQPKDLTCTLSQVTDYKSCPDGCTCKWRRWDESIIFDCSNNNMEYVPKLLPPSPDFWYNQTEVFLQRNSLTAAPTEHDGYENVTRLHLSFNKIRNVTWVPPKIEVLALDHNEIERLDGDVLGRLNGSGFVRGAFEGNPWVCDCKTMNFTSFLLTHLKKVDTANVTCRDGVRKVVKLSESDLCAPYTVLVLVLCTTIACLFFVIAVGLALFYRYQQEVKVWLYAHNMFMWWVTEQEVDKDKLYDAFICFSHKDAHFVMKKLVPILEEGPKPYKLCIHVRDWVPGEFITTQIIESVACSRRTIIVLSKNFVDSVWGKMEFRTAHKQSMSEGRARVILVLYGDVDLNEDLDEELKAYTRTNTYIKWGDPWFWDKMKYALPHAKKPKSTNQQKLQNIMYAMDDKFNLVIPQTPTPTEETTPPIVTVDPLIARNSDLSAGNKTVTEAEHGLKPLLVTVNT